MQIRCIRVYNDYFIDKAKFLSDNSLVMAKKAILKEINTKSKSDLATFFTVPETLSLTKKMNQDLELLRKPSSLYIKSHGNNECLKDMVVNWP